MNIGIGYIYPHPDNPRKDLGDLTELTESVKANGILQNLTVVARPAGGYTCIIGHRRLAAANAAGLEEVPCRIAELTETEQLAMMLAENMQRADLTVYEQAMGVQMMLDLGETVASVAKATGLSETTVRRREKVAQLPREGLAKAVDRGATLFDLEKIMDVEDPEEREKLLAMAGTGAFQQQISYTIRRQENRRFLEKAAEAMSRWARRIEKKDVVSGVFVPMDTLRYWYPDKGNSTMDPPADAGERRYYFVAEPEWMRITLLADHKDAPGQDEEERKRRERQQESSARAERLGELTKKYYDRRRAFVEELNPGEKKWADVMEACFRAITGPRKPPYMSRDMDGLGQMIGASWNQELREFDYQDLTRRMMECPAKLALTAAWWEMDDPQNGYWNRRWDGTDMRNVYSDNPRLDAVYKILKRFGYWAEVEEEQLRLDKHDLLDEMNEGGGNG